MSTKNVDRTQVPESPGATLSPPDRGPRLGIRRFFSVRWIVVIGTVVALVVASLVIPAQWLGRITPGQSPVDVGAVAVKRGAALPTSDRVSIEGVPVFDNDGEILLTTVAIDSNVTIWEWVESAVVDHIELRPRSELFGDRSPSEQRTRNLALMRGSKDAAVVAALAALGVQSITQTGIGFGYVVQDGPVAGLVEVTEVIIGIDDQPVTTMESLRAILNVAKPGERALLVLEDVVTGRVRQVEFVYGTRPNDEPGGFIGVGDIMVRNTDIALPFDITIDSGSIGGPSAGLAFTLTLIDLLTEGELTGGAVVAATGTITVDGTIGNVGGVKKKAAVAKQAGAELFIVPTDSVTEAKKEAGTMPVIGVTSLSEALDALAELGGDTQNLLLDLPNPA